MRENCALVTHQIGHFVLILDVFFSYNCSRAQTRSGSDVNQMEAILSYRVKGKQLHPS